MGDTKETAGAASTSQIIEMVKKHKIALFLHNGTKYVRIKKSETLTLSMNPEETEYNYIADESASTEVDSYKPTIDQDLTKIGRAHV